jgi:ribosomal protein S18 acetylase RimI-like enzyme
MQFSLRQATAEDLDILDSIHTKNMKGYVERVYPWNATLFRNNFHPEEYQVIELNQKIIGFMKVVLSKQELYLAEIQILEKYQNQGIGTKLISSLIQEAEDTSKRLWLKVLKGNPAENLYKRLGFIVFAESLTHKQMVLVSHK